MAIITVKHLAKEFDWDPYDLRMALRKAGLTPINRRWKWEDTKSDHYKKCRKVAQSKKSTATTKPAPKPSKPSAKKSQPSAPGATKAAGKKSSAPKTPAASTTTTGEGS